MNIEYLLYAIRWSGLGVVMQRQVQHDSFIQGGHELLEETNDDK
jgi:hypothetical protein